MRTMFVVYLGLIVAGIAYLSVIGLSLTFLALFLAALVFQAIAGHADVNEQQDRHGDPRISFLRYVTSSQFGVGVMENWQGFCSAGRPSPRSWTRAGGSPTRTRWWASTPTSAHRGGPG